MKEEERARGGAQERSLFNHSCLSSILKNATSVNDGLHITQVSQLESLPRGYFSDDPFVKINDRLIASAKLVDESLFTLPRVEFPRRGAVSEKDSGVALSDDGTTSTSADSDRGMLSTRTAAKVFAGDDDGILGVEAAFRDVTGGVQVLRKPDEGVGT